MGGELFEAHHRQFARQPSGLRADLGTATALSPTLTTQNEPTGARNGSMEEGSATKCSLGSHRFSMTHFSSPSVVCKARRVGPVSLLRSPGPGPSRYPQPFPFR